MTDTNLLPAQKLRKLIRYDPDSGKLFWLPREPGELPNSAPGHGQEWKARNWNSAHAGKEICYRRREGYIIFSIQRRQYRAHRVAWAIFHGEWPKGVIDHINGDPSDNRIANLRLVDDIGNSRNAKLPVTNTSGCVGVHFSSRTNRWSAKIGVGIKDMHLGTYRTMDEAIAARKAAEKVLGYSGRHGT